MEKQKCEFCDKNTYTVSTMTFSNYCISCIEIVIAQSKEAIEEIREVKDEN